MKIDPEKVMQAIDAVAQEWHRKIQADPTYWKRRFKELAGELRNDAQAQRVNMSTIAKKPRRSGKLPEQYALLQEFNELMESGRTKQQARSVLYSRYSDVQPDAIRKKLKRAQIIDT